MYGQLLTVVRRILLFFRYKFKSVDSSPKSCKYLCVNNPPLHLVAQSVLTLPESSTEEDKDDNRESLYAKIDYPHAKVDGIIYYLYDLFSFLRVSKFFIIYTSAFGF